MSYAKPRITDLSMSFTDCVNKLSDGNPGATVAILECVKITPKVDPDSAWGSFSVLFSLDNLDCYGPHIWLLYKDVCKQNATLMLAVLRALQLGFISDENLHRAINNHGDGIDTVSLLAKVRERLPSFAREDSAAPAE